MGAITMSGSNIQAYNALANKYKPIMKIVTWEVAEGTLLTRQQLVDMVNQTGMPGTCVTKELRDRAKAERTLNVLEDELKELDDSGVLTVEEETEGHTIWLWMTHEIKTVQSTAGEYLDATVEVPRRFLYDKEAKTIHAFSDRLVKLRAQANEFTKNGFVHGVPGFNILDAAREIGELQDQVADTQLRITELMSHFGQILLPKDIRAFLTRVIFAAHGLPMRSRGGAYIVPAPMFHIVEAMQKFMAILGPQGCHLKVINLFDTAKLVSGIEDLARILQMNGANVPTEIEDILEETKNELNNRGDIDAVFQAFEADFINSIRLMRDDLAKDRQKCKNTRDGTIDNKLVDLQNLTERVDMFASLLEFQAKDYKKVIKEVEDEIETYANEIKTRRQHR